MDEKALPLSALNHYEPVEPSKADALLKKALARENAKIVVLDDDPTGIQTVHDVHVYTDWSYQSILEGFQEDNRMFFLLTNSRSMTENETRAVHMQIADGVLKASQECGKPFILHQQKRFYVAGTFSFGNRDAAQGDRAPWRTALRWRDYLSVFL